jgi:hypothetical protein
MAVTLLQQIAVGEAPPFVPINVEQYHEMIRVGILPEGAPVELIDGLLSDTDEPEPDVALVKGPPEAYADHHPTPADVIAAIEVAESSLRFDRTTKQCKYALAGIGQYWIANLAENQIEVYQEPLVTEGRYVRRDDYRPGQVLSLALGSSVTIEVAVSEILPP